MYKSTVNYSQEPLFKKGLFFFDRDLLSKHDVDCLIGVDEAGRGPLAGPVVACACVIYDFNQDVLTEVNDSKKITPAKRSRIFSKLISSPSVKFSFAYSQPCEIDRINILNATLKAMKKAVERLIYYNNLYSKKILVIVDGNKKIPDLDLNQIAVPKGDSKSLSVACSSIFAKVLRDRWMDVISANYPEYNFKKHKGYPTKYHVDLIKKYGLSPIHRKSFSPCKELFGE